jgi:hypothetical protein
MRELRVLRASRDLVGVRDEARSQAHSVVVAIRAPDPVPSLRYRAAPWAIPVAALGVALAVAILAAAALVNDRPTATAVTAATATTTSVVASSSTAVVPRSEAELWYREHLLLLGDLEATASTAANAAVVDDPKGTVAGCRKLTVLTRRAAAIPPLPDANFAPEWDQALREFRDGAASCEAGVVTSDAKQFRAGAITLVAALARLDRISTAFR